MYKDSAWFFATLDLPANPILPDVLWPASVNCPSEIARHTDEILVPEVRDWIADMGLTVDFLLLWTWFRQPNNDEFYEIHSDGSIDTHHRFTAINWLVEGISTVEWYSFEGGSPKHKTYKSDTFPLTEWIYQEKPKNLAQWTGDKPALLNIEQPHQVKVWGDGTIPRRSVTIRFVPNLPFVDMLKLCGNRVRSININ